MSINHKIFHISEASPIQFTFNFVMFDIDRILDNPINPEAEKFILSFFHQNNFFGSLNNLIFGKDTPVRVYKFESKDLILIEEICKHFIKHKSRELPSFIRAAPEDLPDYKRIDIINYLIEEVMILSNRKL